MMTRLLATLLSLLVAVYPASAAVVQITTKDAAGTTRNFSVTTNSDITGNLVANGTICGRTDGTVCVDVGTAGSPSTNALTVQPITLGNGTSANAPRVTLSSDSTGQVSLAAGAATIGALTANQSVNATQINGVTPLMGNGTTGTGSPRVTIASDNTAFAVNSTLSAETTKVIGTTRMVGNIGGVLDAIGQNVAAPANWLQAGCQFQTTPTTITATNGSPCQMDNAGNILVNVKTATGLAQGSTTSGQSGSMIMGAVTTANPSYTTAQTAYASLDTKGNLRSSVVNGGSFYQHVAASQTAAVLQSSTGAAGDYLSHCVIYPSTTAAGSVTVFDNANAAATNVIEFTTGTLSNLAPVAIPVGAISTAGAWKVTTGANETVVCYGKFS